MHFNTFANCLKQGNGQLAAEMVLKVLQTFQHFQLTGLVVCSTEIPSQYRTGRQIKMRGTALGHGAGTCPSNLA